MLLRRTVLAQSSHAEHSLAKPLNAIKSVRVLADDELRRRNVRLEQIIGSVQHSEHTLLARVAGLNALLQQTVLESNEHAIKQKAHCERALAEQDATFQQVLEAQSAALLESMAKRLEERAAADAGAIRALTTSLGDLEGDMERQQRLQERQERSMEYELASRLEAERSVFLQAQLSRQEAEEQAGRAVAQRHRRDSAEQAEQAQCTLQAHSEQLLAEGAASLSAMGASVAQLEAEQERRSRIWLDKEALYSEAVERACSEAARAKEEARALRASLEEERASREEERQRFEAERQQSEEGHARRWQHFESEIAATQQRHADDGQRLRSAHEAALADCHQTIDSLKAQVQSERVAHASEVGLLHERLLEHSEALHTARRNMDAVRLDAERAAAERQRDGALQAALERSRRMCLLETGMQPRWPHSLGVPPRHTADLQNM